jgi:hypothetical protein
MIRKPGLAEWDISAVAVGARTYLADDLRFEDIAFRAATRAQVTNGQIRPYMDLDEDDPKDAHDARQAIFVLKMDCKACDLLYHAPDGMRGRYWQSPDHGFLATKHLISNLLPMLLSFAENNTMETLGNAASMSQSEVQQSLELPSAKAWPVERNWMDDRLIVRRWVDNELKHPWQTAWRRGPTGDSIDVKGGLLGLDGTEYIPKCKRDRSSQLFQSGFA